MPKAPRRQPQSLKGKTVMTNNLYPHDTGETPGHATPRENAAMSGAILGTDASHTTVDESAITDAALLADLVADYQASLDDPDGGGS
jgi:hypothetical protein